jgi:GT2 family glycosyltransferase
LQECIESIYRSVRRTSFEVLVVDNGSTDGSVEMVKDRFPDVALVENQSNLGFAAANNQGIMRCGGELILLLNSDTRVLDGAIDASVEYMEHNLQTGVLGCRIVNPDGTFQSSYFRFESLLDLFVTHCLGLALWLNLLERYLGWSLNFRSRYWGEVFRVETEVDVVAGCFFLTRRRVVNRCDGLDEDFYFYGEEEEWCHRINRSGWKVVYYPFAEIIHVHGASSQKLPSLFHVGWRKARLLVLEKTRGFCCAWLGNLIMTAGVLLRIPAWIVTGRSRPFGVGKDKPASSVRLEILKFHLASLLKAQWRRQAPRREPACLKFADFRGENSQ